MPEKATVDFGTIAISISPLDNGVHLFEALDLEEGSTYPLHLFPHEISELIEMLQEYNAALEAEAAQKDLEREMQKRDIDDVRDWWTR